MPVYLVSYDLIGRETIDDYKTLIAELKRMKAKTILYSQWVLRSNMTPVQLRDHLREFIDSNDRILVIEVPTDRVASTNALCKTTDV
jgi:hypothetical protein